MSDTVKTKTNMSDAEKARRKKLRLRIFIFAGVAAALLITLACIFIPKLIPITYYECGFENTDIKSGFDWSVYNYRGNSNGTNASTITFVSGVSPNGKCLKIENTSPNDCRIHKSFKVSPSSFYKVTLSIKTENVSDGAGANLSGYNYNGKAFATTGTTEWRTASVILETAADQKNVNISLGLGGYGSESTGVAYFDNLKIEKISKDEVPEGHVTLKLTPTGKSSTSKPAGVGTWFKILFVLVLLASIVFCFAVSFRNDRTARPANDLRISEKNGKFKKNDVIIVLVMTLITGIFSFVGMGSTSGSANTYWKPALKGDFVRVSFKEVKNVTRVVYYGGIPEKGTMSVQYLGDDGEYHDAADIQKSDISFYRWDYKAVKFTAKTVRVVAKSEGLWLNEVGFYEEVDGKLQPVEIDQTSIYYEYNETDTSGNPGYLFDEQSELRPYRSYTDSTYFDEIYHPRTAYEQIHGLSIYERTHPPLGKVIMEFGILLFGMNSFGWRFSGVLFGMLLVPLIYAFALKVFKKSQWAFVAAFLMMFDFMRLAQTRLATIDTYACFFSVAMMYFMYDYFSVKSYERGLGKSFVPLFLSGLMFGLGAASKWTCLYTGAALAIVFFIAKIREILDVKAGRAYDFSKKDGSLKKIYMSDYVFTNLLPTLGICVVFFVIIPLCIYVLSYLQYMPSNPGKSLIQVVLDNQKYMYDYHSQLVATHPYSSMWYSWPFMARPIWYYVGTSAAGMRSTISSFGNPAIWWLGVPCLFVGSFLAWRNKDSRMGFFVVAYALQFAPWILVNRVCFIYHYFSAFAFSIFFIVYVFMTLVEKKIISKWVVFIYLGVVLVLFVVFYPVLTGMTVPESYVNNLEWLSTWSF